MDTETKLRCAEHELLSLILSEGILDYFEFKECKTNRKVMKFRRKAKSTH